jgi:hypothetical protein
MLALRDLQTQFREALLQDDERACSTLSAEIADGDLSAMERLAVYRNNVFSSLTDALKETFPAVCRLVDERFFSYAAHEFVVSHPPRRPSLTEYGSAFPGFLAEFPPCRELHYLPDVARFEWLMNAAAHAEDTKSVSPEALAGTAPEDAPRLMFQLHPSYGYLASRFPVHRIWRANRPEACGETVIDLDSGGVHLEVSRQGWDVVFRMLDEASFAFRRALAAGSSLGDALARAFAIKADFAASDALTALFAEGAVTAMTLDHSCLERAP